MVHPPSLRSSRRVGHRSATHHLTWPSVGCAALTHPTRTDKSAVGRLEMPVEEVGRGLEALEPGAVGEEGVDLVGDDELLDLDAVLAQVFDEADGLPEGDVAVVVA